MGRECFIVHLVMRIVGREHTVILDAYNGSHIDPHLLSCEYLYPTATPDVQGHLSQQRQVREIQARAVGCRKFHSSATDQMSAIVAEERLRKTTSPHTTEHQLHGVCHHRTSPTCPSPPSSPPLPRHVGESQAKPSQVTQTK